MRRRSTLKQCVVVNINGTGAGVDDMLKFNHGAILRSRHSTQNLQLDDYFYPTEYYVSINPFTADPVKALHFVILV